MGLLSTLGKLLSISTYQRPALGSGLSLGSPAVERARQAFGGSLQLPPQSVTRWYLDQLETAEHEANRGQLRTAAQLARSVMTDGVVAGVMGTRCQGLLHLPKKFRGPPEIIQDLQAGGDEYTRSVFDEMCPTVELAKILQDGVFLGVAVGWFQPVPGRDFPVLRHLNPEHLRFQWNENRWYYHTVAGPLEVNPGDPQWFLHCPGGATEPWRQGLYLPIGKAWVRKQHALLAKSNYEDSLANAAKIIHTPAGSTDDSRRAMLEDVSGWGVDNTFVLTPGFEIKLLEAGSEGWACFGKTIEEQDRQIIIAIASQTPTTDGGSGFSNIDIHRSIRNDLIRSDAAALAYSINTQALPVFVAARYGEGALDQCPIVEWDVTPPLDRQREAQALSTTAAAITQLQATKLPVDYRELCIRAGIPLLGDPNATADEIEIDLDELDEPTPLKALPGGKS